MTTSVVGITGILLHVQIKLREATESQKFLRTCKVKLLLKCYVLLSSLGRQFIHLKSGSICFDFLFPGVGIHGGMLLFNLL